MKCDERGFTLMELILATAITGMLAGALGTIVFQAVTVPEAGNSRLLAIHELENTAFWVQRDGQMAASATGGSQLTLTMPDDTLVTYALSGSSLNRASEGDEMTLARSITAATFAVSGRVITLDITSAPPGRQAVARQAVYEVYLRPAEDP